MERQTPVEPFYQATKRELKYAAFGFTNALERHERCVSAFRLAGANSRQRRDALEALKYEAGRARWWQGAIKFCVNL